MKVGVLVLFIVIATACSSDPSKPASQTAAPAAQTAQASADGKICTYDRPTGSYLKQKRCTTAAERETAARQQDILMDQRNSRDSGIDPR